MLLKGAVDQRNQIPDMISIHVRPLKIEDRVMPRYWEVELIKVKAKTMLVGKLVERTSGYAMLMKMNDATATLVVGWRSITFRWPCAKP